MGKVMARFKRVLMALRTGWSIAGVTLIVLLVVEAGLRFTFAVRDRMSGPQSPDPRILAEAYAGATWLVEHYREIESLDERREPYVYYRPRAFSGKTITIGTDGLRATWHPTAGWGDEAGQKKAVKVLMLGGSALWGFGVRDDQTIPSLLARKLHERGRNVELRNLAELGYVSTQELVALVRELERGYRPDVVIFYDGVNDTASAVLSGEAGLTTNESNRRREFNLLHSPRRLAAALAGKLVTDSGFYRLARAIRGRIAQDAARPGLLRSDETTDRLSRDVADRYIANVGIIEALAQRYGFRPLFFWQPTIFKKATLTAVEHDEAAKFAWAEPAFRGVYERINKAGELKGDSAFHDLSGVFAGDNGLVFIDYCHTTEAANGRIAERMAAAVDGGKE